MLIYKVTYSILATLILLRSLKHRGKWTIWSKPISGCWHLSCQLTSLCSYAEHKLCVECVCLCMNGPVRSTGCFTEEWRVVNKLEWWGNPGGLPELILHTSLSTLCSLQAGVNETLRQGLNEQRRWRGAVLSQWGIEEFLEPGFGKQENICLFCVCGTGVKTEKMNVMDRLTVCESKK